MGIIEHIERIRRDKPEEYRKRMAFAYSAGFTAIVFAVWLSIIVPSELRRVAEARRSADSSEASAGNTWKDVMKSMSDGYETMQRDLSQFAGLAAAKAASSTKTASTTADGDFAYENGYDTGQYSGYTLPAAQPDPYDYGVATTAAPVSTGTPPAAARNGL